MFRSVWLARDRVADRVVDAVRGGAHDLGEAVDVVGHGISFGSAGCDQGVGNDGRATVMS